MWNHQLAYCLAFLLTFLALPAFPQDKPATERAHPTEVEIVLPPSSIKSIKVVGYPGKNEMVMDMNHRQLLLKAEPYAKVLPYPGRFSEDQLTELLKDRAKWRGIYHEQMHELLKEQFYLWEELNTTH